MATERRIADCQLPIADLKTVGARLGPWLIKSAIGNKRRIADCRFEDRRAHGNWQSAIGNRKLRGLIADLKTVEPAPIGNWQSAIGN
jgi:hypothetical protein